MSILRKLSADMQNFNADTAERVKGYWPEIPALRINLIVPMMEIRDQLNREFNPELNRKFKDLTQSFIQYLENQDPENPDKTYGLLFEITKIAELQLHEAIPQVLRDIAISNLEKEIKVQLVQAFEENAYAKIPEILKKSKKI